MLRKLSTFLLSGMILVILSACSSSSDSDPVFIAAPEGTYDVTFFGTVTKFAGADIVISDNCTKATTYGVTPDGATCDNLTRSTGEIVISATGDKLKIISKLQMEGGMVEFSPTDKFQYTEYNPIVPSIFRSSGSGEGVSGYNLDLGTGDLTTTPINYPDSPFKFILIGNELTIDMTLKNKVTIVGTVDAKTTVKAIKRNDNTTPPNKDCFWNFQ